MLKTERHLHKTNVYFNESKVLSSMFSKDLLKTFNYMYAHVCTHMSAIAHGGQKRAPDPLELEL